jgi:hypothetical protein
MQWQDPTALSRFTRNERSAMGRKSRERRERRERQFRDAARSSAQEAMSDPSLSARAAELEDQLTRLADGDAAFWASPNLPDSIRISHLEDILAFESVGSATSLFRGLQEHGVDLPPPDRLNEGQSARKAMEVMRALARLRVYLVGFECMTPREFYFTLYNQTLWEGCYVEKQTPGLVTIIDVSHSLSRQDWLRFLGHFRERSSVH